MLAAFIAQDIPWKPFFLKSLARGQVYKYSYFNGGLSTTDDPDLRK